MDLRARVDEARGVVATCKTEKGFRASTSLYPELWMRDLVFSEDVLLSLGYADTVRRHLEEFLRRQRDNGNLPTVITSPLRRVLNQSFHFWTSDTEVLCLIGICKYAKQSGDSGFLKEHSLEIDRCLGFIRGRLDGLGLLPGMDWRDAVPNYQGEDLLANQVLLAEAYGLMGRSADSEELKRMIAKSFLLSDRGYYADSIGKDGMKSTRLDCLGNSLAVTHDVPGRDQTTSLTEALKVCKTERGYKNISPPHMVRRLGALASFSGVNAFLRNGAIFRNRPHNYQNSAIWPFVEARIVRALLKIGLVEEAKELARLMLNRKGFYEWYSPFTGEPRGSSGQLWTAAAVLEVAETFPDLSG